MRVIAHRAGNELARLERLGAADVVECDVHLRRGRLEVRHTKKIWFLPVLWDRWYLVNPFAPPLLLEHLLDAVPRETTLMIDMKGPTPGLGRAVLRTVDAHGPRPLVVSARVWRHLRPFAGRPGTIVLHSAGSPRQLRRLLRRYPAGSLDGVSVHRRLLDPVTVAALRDRAAHVWSWPVDDPVVARELARWGVTGFISDAWADLADGLSAEAPPPAGAP